MSGHALIVREQQEQAIVEMVLDGLPSPHSRRAYQRALTDFMRWYRETGQTRFGKATVQRYRRELQDAGMGASSINQRLSAIRKLAAEGADNGAMPGAVAQGIARVKGVRQEGERTGNWLGKGQADALLDAPPRDTLKGVRDRALLAVALGCGLRRQELADLTFEHVQMRDARWVIVNLVGKRNKTRSVPMPSWAKTRIDAWAEAAGLFQGRIFRAVNKGGRVVGEGMSAQSVYRAVQFNADALSLGVAAHDLRRSYAKLAHKGGSPVDQIQLSLGHASLQTTEVYLGIDQDLQDAPCDHLGLSVEAT